MRETLVIQRARRAGKTADLVAIAKADDTAVIVVASRDQARLLVNHWKVPPAQVISAAQARNALHGRRDVRLLIDNTEQVLAAMLGNHQVDVCITNNHDFELAGA